eukprot:sb/3466811/
MNLSLYSLCWLGSTLSMPWRVRTQFTQREYRERFITVLHYQLEFCERWTRHSVRVSPKLHDAGKRGVCYKSSFFRLAPDGSSSNTRLLGTEVSLIGPTTTTVCGTISSLNPGGTDATAQTYSVPCPAITEPTLAVKLTDNDPSSAETSKNKDKIIMNIAEVAVYLIITKGFHMPFCFAKRHSRVRIRKRHFGILTNRVFCPAIISFLLSFTYRAGKFSIMLEHNAINLFTSRFTPFFAVQVLTPLQPILASRRIDSRSVENKNSRARNKSTFFSSHDDSPSTRRLSRDGVGACSQVFKDWSCLASILTHYSLNADTRGYFP